MVAAVFMAEACVDTRSFAYNIVSNMDYDEAFHTHLAFSAICTLWCRFDLDIGHRGAKRPFRAIYDRQAGRASIPESVLRYLRVGVSEWA